MVEVIELTKRFGKIIAVNNVSLNVRKGEIFAIIGPSGCGKTTLLRCIAGLEVPDKGTIIIDNEIVFDSVKKIFIPPEKRNIGMVFQFFAVWPHMTVYDNIAYPLKHKRLPKDEIKRIVLEALEMTKLRGLENKYPPQLSGGQQQRVALARAIAMRPKLILFDEPTSNLDAKLAEDIRRDIKILLKKLGITAIYVTHDQVEAFMVADRVAIMKEGVILQVGTPHEVYEKPYNSFVAEFVGTPNIVNASIISELEFSEGLRYFKVVSEIGELIVKGDISDLNIGKRVKLAIRAEHINICNNTHSHREIYSKQVNILRGRIASKAFLGDKIFYLIEIGGIYNLKVYAPPTIDLKEGVEVDICISPNNIIVVKEE
jgi:ABC-type Fe3+/spermidine/putrescine transport system ATPase subunit